METCDLQLDNLGRELHDFVTQLYPLHRSITGHGVRKTLALIAAQVPLQVYEVPTGTHVFDWQVPQEWNIRDAYIKDAEGRRLVDYRASNLHVVSYSTPVRQRLSWDELKEHLHTLPEQPELIPYRTAYFRDTWGFCLTQRQYGVLEAMETLAAQPFDWGSLYAELLANVKKSLFDISLNALCLHTFGDSFFGQTNTAARNFGKR